jgi:hypothetical protein
VAAGTPSVGWRTYGAGCATLVLAACLSVPAPTQYRAGVAPQPPGAGGIREATILIDGRSRFRQTFCEIVRRDDPIIETQDPSCETLLWRLSDEGSPRADGPGPPASDPSLRAIVVTGAFSDCLGPDALPFGDAVPALQARGHRIEILQVSGRSSADRNAQALTAALSPQTVTAGDRLVLIGYSKGSVDILHFLATDPAVLRNVAAVVSIAGAVYGAPRAGADAWLYDGLLAGLAPGRCDPGDGGVVDSLVPAYRRDWMARHALPAGIRFYSFAAFPQRERLALALRGSWNVLARLDRRNDGEIIAGDALIPGSTLLGFANADHFGVALRVERSLPHLVSRSDPRPFPQQALLEALLATVTADLAAQAWAARGPRAAPTD